MILFAFGIIACFLLGDLMYRRGAPAELSRKTVHVAACLLIGAFPLFGIDYRELFVLAAGSFTTLVLLRGSVLVRSITAVERQSYGELMIPLSVAMVAPIGLSYPAFLAAYLVLGVSDTLASLVGSAYGRRRYTLFGHAKTYVGSAAFFVSGLLILVPVALLAGLPAAAAVLVAVAVSGVLTVVEALSHKGVDNLFLPLAAAASLQPLLSL